MNEFAILWFLRFKQLKSRLRFWLAALGYNTSDRSATNQLYFAYIILFFSAWGVMVLSLLSSIVTQYLFTEGLIPIHTQASLINLFVFLVWFSAKAYMYLSHSPMLFSEEDSLLICQTPIRRNLITFIEFLFDWPFKFAPFFILGTILSLSVLEANLVDSFAISMFPEYLLFVVRTITIIAPFHLSLYCLLWVIGLGRLQGRFKTFAPTLIGISLLSVIVVGVLLMPTQTAMKGMEIVDFLWPIAFPVMAAYEADDWLLGVLLSLFCSSLGFFFLNTIGKDLNLTNVWQAAIYESQQRILLQTGYTGASLDLAKRHALGEERQSVSFPYKSGVKLLIQKDFIQSFRYIAAQDLIGWFLIPLLFYLLFQFADPMMQWIVIAYLILIISRKAIARMSDDLKFWWVFRSLPLAAETILIGNLARTYFFVIVLLNVPFWLAVFTHKTSWVFSLFIPFAVAIIFLVAIADLFRQSKRESLLNGLVADISGFSMVVSLFCLMVIFGVYGLTSSWGGLAVLLILLIFGIILFVCWKLATQYFYSL